MTVVRRVARMVGWAGLAACGALHAVWASGSTWPVETKEELAEAVVGNPSAMPSTRATWVVSGLAFFGGAVAAGGLGEGPGAVWLRRAMGAGLLARAVLGGDVALSVLGLPPAGERFRRLDGTAYRPLFALLGVALIAGARKPEA
ncbi:MAG: DUF3995 domain-containing protein [Arachnia sp.]